MKIGLTTGCFDLFHMGHRHLLTIAGTECTLLIVAVNHDSWCVIAKGAGRPFVPLMERMRDVREFGARLHDACRRSALFTVIPFDGNDGDLARAICPDVIIRGYDQSANFSAIPVVRVGEAPGVSTTLLAAQRSPGETVQS